MRYLLLLSIHLYWIIPKKNRRQCIFKESCSKYVYRVTKNEGWKKGLLAIQGRRRQCRPGFYHINKNVTRLADDSVICRLLLHQTE